MKDVANKLTVELPGEWRHDDTKIASVIREALIWDVDVPEERIDAIVRSGAVTLKGTVDHWQQRERAAEIVSHVIGVTRVDNDILVAAAARSDREIHDDVNSALRRRLPSASDIDVVVEDGRVVVMGTVPSLAARSDATSVVLSTAGVRTVSDRIVVARQGRLRERHERAARTALVGR